MRSRSLKLVITFATTTEAMKMEQAAQEEGRNGRLIPLPTQISAGCGLAFCAEISQREELEVFCALRYIEIEGIYEVML